MTSQHTRALQVTTEKSQELSDNILSNLSYRVVDPFSAHNLCKYLESSPKHVIINVIGDPSDETGKIEAPCHSRCDMIKIPPCSKALSAEHRPKFCSPSPAMVTSPYK
jgi:hypothetical protein